MCKEEIPVPRFVVRLQRRWRRWVQLAWWAMALVWRIANGGWYVYRDFPAWFVYLMAKVALTDKDSADGQNLVSQAKNEVSLRRQLRKRRLHQRLA